MSPAFFALRLVTVLSAMPVRAAISSVVTPCFSMFHATRSWKSLKVGASSMSALLTSVSGMAAYPLFFYKLRVHIEIPPA